MLSFNLLLELLSLDKKWKLNNTLYLATNEAKKSLDESNTRLKVQYTQKLYLLKRKIVPYLHWVILKWIISVEIFWILTFLTSQRQFISRQRLVNMMNSNLCTKSSYCDANNISINSIFLLLFHGLIGKK